MNKINYQNRNRLMDSKKTLTAISGERELGGLVEKVKGLRKKKKQKTQTQATVW